MTVEGKGLNCIFNQLAAEMLFFLFIDISKIY